MKNTWKNVVDYIGTSRLVVIGFLLVLMISVFPLGINPGMIYSDCIVRIGMNGFSSCYDDLHCMWSRIKLWSSDWNSVWFIWRINRRTV